MPANIKKCLHIARGKYLLFLDRSGLISTLCNHKSHKCEPVSLTSADCDNVVDVKASSNGFDQDFRRVMLAVQCKNRNTVIIYFSTSANDLPLLDLVNSAVQLAVIAPKNQYSNILLGFQNDTKHLLIAEDTTDKLTIYFYEKTPCNPNCLTCSSTSKDHCTSCRPGGVIEAANKQCVFTSYCSSPSGSINVTDCFAQCNSHYSKVTQVLNPVQGPISPIKLPVPSGSRLLAPAPSLDQLTVTSQLSDANGRSVLLRRNLLLRKCPVPAHLQRLSSR